MEADVDRVLIDRARIAARVRELAGAIARDLGPHVATGGEPCVTLIAVLTGSLIFLSDLIRQMPLMMRVRLVAVSSYPGTATSSVGPRMDGQLPEDLTGQHVLIVDDILDSGKTIAMVRGLVERRNPASVRTCALLRKQIASAMDVHADYVGFDIPNEFVVGYGLDYNGLYRNLPDVVTLKAEVTR